MRRLTAQLERFMFVLGFRPVYRLEIFFSVVGLIAFMVSILFLGPIYAAAASAIPLALPAILQIKMYRERYVRMPTVPLFSVIASAVAAAFDPFLLPVALLNAALIEDITVFFRYVDIVRVKHVLHLLVLPITRRELSLLVAISTLCGIVAYVLTWNVCTLVYPAISYALLAYSVITMPETLWREEVERRSIFEEIARRIPILNVLVIKLYRAPSIERVGREAGLIGLAYDRFIHYVAGIFAFTVYVMVVVAPILFIFIGNLTFPLIVAVILTTLFTPYVILQVKRSSRRGKIERNIPLILSYLASMKSVAESFTNAMLQLKLRPALAKLFALKDEVKIYLNIYTASSEIESIALRKYAETIPSDYLRDTIRTMQDIEENEGVGAAFRSLVERLRDYVGRYITGISTRFQTITSNVISVTVYVESILPIIMFLSAPRMLPFTILMAGLLAVLIISGVTMTTLPDLPSEYVHAKKRYRYGAVLSAVVALMLTVIEMKLVPGMLPYVIPLNIPVAVAVAVWYASQEDMALNKEFLEKFSDILILFSSSMSRVNNVEFALLEMAQQSAFSRRLREKFKQLASLFRTITIEKIPYKGVYWYKYFMFMVSLSASYGTTPRHLYKAISDFMLEFKRFFNMVSSFGRSIVFLTLVGLFVMTLEVNVATIFLSSMSGIKMVGGGLASGIVSTVTTFIPKLSPHEAEQIAKLSYAALLVVAIMNGWIVGKALSGTYRDAKWVAILFTVELLLIYVAMTTSFGFALPHR